LVIQPAIYYEPFPRHWRETGPTTIVKGMAGGADGGITVCGAGVGDLTYFSSR
jgi:hypothetical protein